MKIKNVLKKMLAFTMTAAMVASFDFSAFADQKSGAKTLKFEQVENSEIKVSALQGEAVSEEKAEVEYKDSDIVRVSIVLAGDSVVDAGYSTEDIMKNEKALKHLNKVKGNQKNAEKKIAKAMGKKMFDVKQNLAIVANIISAEVAYGDIDVIESVNEVEKVVVETQYAPAVSEEVARPQMAVAVSNMTGATAAWAEGFTGAGSRLAIIDTGIDIYHQSFNNDAFNYALAEDAAKAGMDLDTYKAEVLNMLTAEEIEEAMPYLNAYARSGGKLTADAVTISEKIPYGYNYVDRNTNVEHKYDSQGEHGSHVGGISTANRYIVKDGECVDAMAAVGVAGNAPDAQILVMKVFGQGGGAYDSDYMAAIEDAIVLNCDSVNLSLGSGNAGMSTSGTYQAIMDKLADTDTVVVMSEGNSGAWADETSYGYLYDDGVNYATGGSPGSFTNSLAVASVENVGQFGITFSVAGNDFGYTETNGYGNAPLASIAGEQEYVFLPGVGAPEEFEGVDVAGKVVFCYRGSLSFFEKANNAVSNGAIATIIVNNQAGSISMNLEGYSYKAPCVSILQAYGDMIKAASTSVNDGQYYTGTLTINEEPQVIMYGDDFYTMSDFSSFGVPGTLTLKPEITAPGGNIWSVNGTNNAGGGVDQYELMSGTSMAAPQVTGMVAVLKAAFDGKLVPEKEVTESTKPGKGNQKEKNNNGKGNGNKKTETIVNEPYFDVASSVLTERGMAQSLLMSTAEPMLDAYGYYYPVFQQGAGLGNVDKAVNAKSYIVMGADATASYLDGKVKAELGDDPERTGVYTYSFTINNVSDQKVKYKLSTDLFTQYAEQGFLFNDTDNLEAESILYSTGDKVTIQPGKSKTVTVTITLGEAQKAALEAMKPEGGAYIEGYTFVTPDDGSSVHSIPVLAYYGSWTDASMYDVGSRIEYEFGMEDRAPYLYASNGTNANNFVVSFADGSGDYYYGANLYADDAEYHPEYASINNENGDSIKSIGYSLIRNAGMMAVTVTDQESGETYLSKNLGSQYAAYYSANSAKWMSTTGRASVGWAGKDASNKLLAEGTSVNVSLVAAPEYYLEADGSIDPSKLGEGAFFTAPVTIDNTAPVVDMFVEEESGTLAVKASDNLAIAAVLVYGANGKTEVARIPVSAPSCEGVIAENLADDIYLVSVIDYAGNAVTYRVFMNIPLTDEVESVELNTNNLVLLKNNTAVLSATVNPINISNEAVTWSSSDETVATVDENGIVTAVAEGDAVITAAAVLDPSMTAECAVTVMTINKTLNGVVWDEEGAVWLSSFNTETIPSYDKMANWNAAINNLAYGNDGKLYATDIDTENGVSNLYTVDDDFNLNMVGTSELAYTEMAQGPSLGNVLVGLYFNYVIIIDATNGDYIGAFNFLTNGASLVGITYDETVFNTRYNTNADYFYLLDSDGNMYSYGLMARNGSFSALGNMRSSLLGNTGIATDMEYFQSMYYDGDKLFVSNFIESTNKVTLYAWDLNNTGYIFEVASFADGVWPVGGLIELKVSADANVSVSKENADEITAEMDPAVEIQYLKKINK